MRTCTFVWASTRPPTEAVAETFRVAQTRGLGTEKTQTTLHTPEAGEATSPAGEDGTSTWMAASMAGSGSPSGGMRMAEKVTEAGSLGYTSTDLALTRSAYLIGGG